LDWSCQPAGASSIAALPEPRATAAEPGVADPPVEAFDGAFPLHATSNNIVHTLMSLIAAHVTAKPARRGWCR
jgi:hypothetical protein